MTTAVASQQATQYVRIKNAAFNGKPVQGLFEFLDFRTEAGKKEVCIKVAGEIYWVEMTATTQVEVVDDLPGDPNDHVTQLNGKMSEAQVERIIKERFETMDNLTVTLCNARMMNSLIITGAAGIGKTYNIEKYLEKKAYEGQHWGSIGGNCSAFGLYESLFEFRNEGSILVMDDVDVFGDEVKLNLLKKALDTGARRVIDWRSASKALDERSLPDSFEFKGKVIFLTNTNMHAEISAQTKRAPHMNALISRSVTLDLGIHCTKTILLHVRNVIRDTNMLVEQGLTHQQQENVIMWLEKNRDELFALSLRTPLMISEMVKANPETWELSAKNTMLKQKSLVY